MHALVGQLDAVLLDLHQFLLDLFDLPSHPCRDGGHDEQNDHDRRQRGSPELPPQKVNRQRRL